MNTKTIISLGVIVSSLLLVGCQSEPHYNTQTSQQTSQVTYLDVREDSERDEGHISGAIHLSLGELEAGNTKKLPKNKTLAIYCRSGRRSAIALNALKSQGFSNIIDLGGMNSIKGVEIIR